MMGVSATPAHGRLRHFTMSALLLVIVLVVSLGLFEVLLRIAGIQAAPLPYDNNLPDAVLGMRPEPGKHWKANFPEYPGELYMRTNNRAFYEPRDTPEKAAPGVLRIGVLGDSHTVGTCKPEENFPNQLEALLNVSAGRPAFEVLNAGVGRYSPYQYYLRAGRELTPIGARRLIVAVYAGNDFLDLIREDDRPHLVARAAGGFEQRRPTFMTYRDPDAPADLFDRSRAWQVARSFLGPTILYQASRVRLLHRNLSALGRGLPEIAAYINEVRLMDRAAHGLMLQSLHQRLWFDRFPETLKTAIAINAHVMELFRELERSEGVAVTYTVIPSKPGVEPEKLGATFAAVTSRAPEFTAQDVAAFEDALIDKTLEGARELGLDTIDLRPFLRRAAASTELYYPLDMHLNVAGNRVIAQALAQHLIGISNRDGAEPAK